MKLLQTTCSNHVEKDVNNTNISEKTAIQKLKLKLSISFCSSVALDQTLVNHKPSIAYWELRIQE